MYASNIISPFTAAQHRIDSSGYGYSRPLDNEELTKAAPSIFASQAHASRSERYSYIPTLDLIDGMRGEGFLPVKVSQARARDNDRLGFCKHLIRFRREDQLSAHEAREVVLVNSHDGSSGFHLMAGIYRLVCANGLIVGQSDHEVRVRHSGDAVSKVIEGGNAICRDCEHTFIVETEAQS